MSTDIIQRGGLTDLIVEFMGLNPTLAAAGVLIGDGIAPDAAGWTGGQPNEGTFVASVTIETAVAQARDRDTVNSRHSSWVANYALVSAGAARSQADDTADMARLAILGLPNFPFRGPWKITDVVLPQLAPVVPNKSTDPPTWEVRDQVQVWLDRRRG